MTNHPEIEQLSLITSLRVEKIFYERSKPGITPFVVGLGADYAGNRHTVLFCGKDWNLDHPPFLIGADISVIPSQSRPGVKAKPPHQQPAEVTNLLFDRLEGGNPTQDEIIPTFNKQEIDSLETSDKEDPYWKVRPALSEVVVGIGNEVRKSGLAAAGWVFFPLDQNGVEF